MKKIIFLAVIITLAPSLSFARQGFTAAATQVNRQPLLAIAEARCLGGEQNTHIAKEIEEVVKFDLDLAGSVRILNRLPKENRDGIRPGEFDYVPWRNAGAAMLLKTGYVIVGDKIMVELRLYDVPAEKPLWSQVITGKRKFVRKMAHEFADETLRIVAGEKGPFAGSIVFVSSRTGNKEVYLMDYDGYNVRRLTRNGSINLNPSFSSDGHKIIFTSYKKGNPDLYLRKIYNDEEIRISSRTGLNVTGAWAPRGDKIALAMSKDGNSEIYLINRNGREQARLTDNDAIDISPSWSPDGSRIAFVSDREGSPQVYVMNSDGTNVRRLTKTGCYNAGPSWSPKGDRILYSRMEADKFQIYAINPDGTGDTRLTDEGRNEYPHWSPDGRFITFTSNRDGKEAIYVMRADGTSQTRVSRGKGDDSQPVWSPRP